MSSIGEVSAGDTFGRYELLVPIALGGMASVWAGRARGPVLKIVAVKLIRAELSDDPDFEQMFLDEASLVSKIRHPNVAELLDLGEEDESLFQVMEWVDGEPLNLLMRDSRAAGGVPLPLALRIIRQACSGLHAAHEIRGPDGELVGLVHRDVSPQNILVGYDGVVRIVDFGIAKAASNMQKTRVGEVKGKVPYMSPEQARGERVDRRSDIFALGIVMYQLLTGKHPFLLDNEPATLRRIGDQSPAETPLALVPSLPADVVAIVLKALEKNRDDRFPTMNEMGRAIDRVMQGAPATAEDLAVLMQRLLGPRGERRRVAIREAAQRIRASEAQPSIERPPDSRTPRSFARDTKADGTSAPAMNAPAVNAHAANAYAANAYAANPYAANAPAANAPAANAPAANAPAANAPAANARETYVVGATPELQAIINAAAANADRSAVPQPPPPIRRTAAVPVWHVRAQSAQRAQIAAFGGIAIGLGLAVIAAIVAAGSTPNDRPSLTQASVRPVSETFLRAARVAAAAAQPPPEPVPDPEPAVSAAPEPAAPKRPRR